jgi:hypothetical protein
VEDGAEELFADLDHAPLHAGGDRGRGIGGVLEVLFEVPAQLLLGAVAEAEGEARGRGRARPPVALEGDLDAVGVRLRFGVLGEAEEKHELDR